MVPSENEVFMRYLRSKGLSVTPERMAVLEAAFSNHGHFTPEELLADARRKGKRLSRASVYRTLGLLLDSGLVRRVEFGTGSGHYEHTAGHPHHDHMVCTKCGRVLDFRDERLEEEKDRVCSDRGFRALRHNLEIFGFCPHCFGTGQDTGAEAERGPRAGEERKAGHRA